jgi:PBP1b-binding outer membrane lipoprotein LpoB
MKRIKTFIFALGLIAVVMFTGGCSEQTATTTKPPTNETPQPETPTVDPDPNEPTDNPNTPSQPDTPSQPNPTPPTPTPPNTPPQTNYWKQLGTALDIVATQNAIRPKLLLDRNGNLVVTWAEDDGVWNLQAKRWTGTAWEKLASKTLPFTEVGVNDFDVVIDSSNALVVSERKSSGSIEIYRHNGSEWDFMDSMQGLVQFQTDSSGNIYTVYQDKVMGENIVRRWDDSNWITVATFTKKYYEESLDSLPPYVYIDGFTVKTDGKPVIAWEGLDSKYDTLSGWNGLVWEDIDTGRYLLAYKLDINNKPITARVFNSGYTVDITQTDETGLSAVNDLDLVSNKPVVVGTRQQDQTPVIQLWTGSTWQQLSGNWKRETDKAAYSQDILTDKQGNIFVAWQESACTNSASCGGGNIYVSQYIP